jgi:molecular chaperone DnaK (HSP70)
VDRDGSLHVYAQNEDTDGEPVKKTFNHEYQLSQDEIEAQIRQAEVHKEEDAIASRIFQLREHLRSIFAMIEKDHKLRVLLHNSIQALELALEARDIEKAEDLFAGIKWQIYP